MKARKKKERMLLVNFRIPAKKYAKLKKKAKSEGLKIANVIRSAVDGFLSEEKKDVWF